LTGLVKNSARCSAYSHNEEMIMNRKSVVFLVLFGLCATGCGGGSAGNRAAYPTLPPLTATAAAEQARSLWWVDTHTYPSDSLSIGKPPTITQDFFYCVDDGCLADMLAIMDGVGTSRAFLMPPPGKMEDMQCESDLAAAVWRRPERFSYMGGGCSLNAMIRKAVNSGGVSDDVRAAFTETAEAILADGAAGFGELAVLYLSLSSNHAFAEMPADHELFLLLADIAARNDVPLDIHMDPVLEDMWTPEELRRWGNPAELKGNIAAFETLLAHNPKARIVWAHTADTTGDLSDALLRDLLGKYPNLYLSLRLEIPVGPAAEEKDNVLDPAGKIREEWLSLFRDYPGRFVIGSDVFWGDGKAVPGQVLVRSFLAQLPLDVAERMACRNIMDIYKLDLDCP
jgi:hypothetical protein